jgi:UDP-N-acetylglucosamine diphosphorylase / glucose-1-phosphate thymidylyltransferase / UDP-N-acetylgalactosamine diphosphorylase / glucosamine-1-phosphate N-acetyltransferase / galactosamine-1-phosphate N-acetyltransferase
MQAVILAAGRGMRLQPLTFKRSKAMMPILGKPMVERVMDLIAARGIRDFILVTPPDDPDILFHFQNNPNADWRVRFVHQPKRRGMAEALSHAAPLIEGDFVLSACDNLVPDSDLQRMMEMWQQKPDAILALLRMPREEISKMGMVEMVGNRIVKIVEKPLADEAPSNIASLPLYIFSKEILSYLPEVKLSRRGEYELQDAIQKLIEGVDDSSTEGTRGVLGAMMSEHLTLTDRSDLLAINQRFFLGNKGLTFNGGQVAGSTTLIPPYYIEPDTVIEEDCVIGPNVFIERDCYIRAKTHIRDAVILRGTRIHIRRTIESEVVG